jgi:hypothetical protein
MPTYRVIRKIDTKTVYAYTADAPVEFPNLPFVEFHHIEEVNINPDGSINAENQGWWITKLAFRNRFKREEKVAIEIASLDNPAAPMDLRQAAADLRASQADQRDATYIDLQRADTRAGVLGLEQAGLIAAGRAAVILDTLPTAEEVYKG